MPRHLEDGDAVSPNTTHERVIDQMLERAHCGATDSVISLAKLGRARRDDCMPSLTMAWAFILVFAFWKSRMWLERVLYDL